MLKLSVMMRKKLRPTLFFVFLLISIILSTISSAFGEDKESIFTPFTRVTLENGLTVIVKETHFAPVVAVDVCVAVGAINEPSDQAGISHFVEHMFFKGTKRRKVGEIAGEIKAVGGNLNAVTSVDKTHYNMVVPSEYVDLLLDITADAIQYSIFDPDEIERERNVILEDLRQWNTYPWNMLFEEKRRQIFAGTPYANSLPGTSDTVNSINREALIAYYHKYYVPNNMVLTVVGDVNTKEVLAQIEELFKDFKPGVIEPSPAVEISLPKESARFEFSYDLRQTYMYFDFPVPPRTSEDGAALSILQTILSGGKSGRLNKLYSYNLVNSVSAEYSSFRQVGMFGINVTTQNPTEVERWIQEALKQVITEGVTADEVALAKAIIRTGNVMNAERALNLAYSIGNYEINGSLEDGIKYERALQEVTKEDVQRVAEEYVNPERTTLFILRPKEAK